MICCLNPNCFQENPPCADGMKYCSTCGTELVLLSDRYRPIQRLGKGGFGITYLAADNARFQKPCVIKQLTLQVPDARRLFEGEAQRLEDLADCPVIPRLLAYHSDVDYLYLVQEFVSGQDLDKELREKGVFDEAAIKKFLNEILPVLDLIHQRGIIHRDIKLENIMRGADGKLVLIDFGIAKLIPANNTPKPGTRAGTDGYAAPEQVKEGLARPASDLYSLGAACFHLLTDINPGSLFMDYGYQWTNKWRQHLPQPISKELKELIDKLLKSEYEDRYQSAEEVLKTLSSHIPEKPASTINSGSKKDARFYMALLGITIGVGTALLMAVIVSSLFPDNNKLPQTATDYFERAYKLDDSDRKGAIEDYTQAIKLKPDYPEAYNNRGLRREESGDHKGAIEDYTQAIALKLDYPEAYNNRGISRGELGDKKGEIEDYTQSIKFNHPQAYSNRGISRGESGDHKGAIEDYTQAIALKSDYPEAYNNRGISRGKSGDHKGAIEDYNQAITLNSDYSEAYYNRGDSQGELGNQEDAIKDYTQAIKIKPDYFEAYNSRGIAWYKLGDNDGAIKDYTQAIKIKPEDPIVYGNRGLSRDKSGDHKGAIEDYTQAIKIKPDYFEAYNNRGLVRSNLGDNDGAIKDYTQAIKIKPDDSVVYGNRGFSRNALGNRKGAIEDYNQSIKLNSSNSLVYGNRCFSLGSSGAHQGAIEDCTQSIKLNPDNPEAYHNRGFSRNALGDRQGAIEDYHQAVELYQKQGRNKDTDENYGNVLRILKELNQ
jgi:serine/threonine protein kinase